MKLTSKLAAASLGLLVVSTGSAAYAQTDLGLNAAARAAVRAEVHRPDFSVVGRVKEATGVLVGTTESEANRIRSHAQALISAKADATASTVHKTAAYRPACSSGSIQVTGHAATHTTLHRRTAEADPSPSTVNTGPPVSPERDAPAPNRPDSTSRGGLSVNGSASVELTGSVHSSADSESGGSAASAGVRLIQSIFSSISANL